MSRAQQPRFDSSDDRAIQAASQGRPTGHPDQVNHRWELLFADLEAQLVAAERRGRDAEVSDRIRADRAGVTLSDRLSAHVGGAICLMLISGEQLTGRLADIGDGWLLVARERYAYLIPLSAVVGVGDLRRQAGDARHRMRFGLGYALRALSRDRAVVAITDRAGQGVTGTIDLVGADCIDVAEHEADQLRRSTNIRRIRTIPLSALVSVRSMA